MTDAGRIEALARRTRRLIEVRYDPRGGGVWRTKFHTPSGHLVDLEAESLTYLIAMMEVEERAHPYEP